MTLKEKIMRISDILYGLSATNSRKKPYDLRAIAESLIARYDPNNPMPVKHLPIYNSIYRRKNAWTSLWYWIQKLKNSNKFNDVIDIIKK